MNACKNCLLMVIDLFFIKDTIAKKELLTPFSLTTIRR